MVVSDRGLAGAFDAPGPIAPGSRICAAAERLPAVNPTTSTKIPTTIEFARFIRILSSTKPNQYELHPYPTARANEQIRTIAATEILTNSAKMPSNI
jgi:hypothetical protein